MSELTTLDPAQPGVYVTVRGDERLVRTFDDAGRCTNRHGIMVLWWILVDAGWQREAETSNG